MKKLLQPSSLDSCTGSRKSGRGTTSAALIPQVLHSIQKNGKGTTSAALTPQILNRIQEKNGKLTGTAALISGFLHRIQKNGKGTSTDISSLGSCARSSAGAALAGRDFILGSQSWHQMLQGSVGDVGSFHIPASALEIIFLPAEFRESWNGLGGRDLKDAAGWAGTSQPGVKGVPRTAQVTSGDEGAANKQLCLCWAFYNPILCSLGWVLLLTHTIELCFKPH